jgi:hypothetical protein
MKTARTLFKIASLEREEEQTANVIYGLCETAAESGDFLCRFDRAEYLISDFDHMRKLGFVVEWDCGTIYVRWA